MKIILIISCFCIAFASFAQQDSTVVDDDDLFDMSLEELLKLDIVDHNFYLYGYINSNLQKTFEYPSIGENEEILTTTEPFEWTPVRNFHIYGKGNFNRKISYLFNLARNEDLLEIRNAWGNFALKDILQVRVGKMYRKFGLYNERLDQIPTFIGIEAPEMLDTDHLFLTRTTNFMIHGRHQNHHHNISYALMTDNGENGPIKNLMPLGWDFRYKSFSKSLIVGTSGYASSINKTKSTSTVGFAEGSPKGGILPWMSGDRFVVAGIFLEKQIGKLLIQSEYYNASHQAERDASAIITLINDGGINQWQRKRFLGANVNSNEPLSEDHVQIKTSYNVQTWYIRLGYNVQTDAGQFIPYVFLDWMSYPEVIQRKVYGGDDEAGLADDGKFWKPSVGLVYKPISNVAIKLDGSYHIQQYNGKQVTYPEIRLDFSFAFSNNQIDKIIGGDQ
jgi:hypothetical protein